MLYTRRACISTLAALTGGGALAETMLTACASSRPDYANRMAFLRRPLPDPVEPIDLVRFATLAANGHNTQPWRFQIRPQQIIISPDGSRRTPVVDPDDHHLFVSLGCAAENLATAAASRGLRAHVSVAGDRVLAELEPGPKERVALALAIPERQSTRATFDGSSVSALELRALEEAARFPGVTVVFLQERAAIDQVADLVVTGNGIQFANPAFMRELKSWVRFNPRQALAAGDGLYSAASGNLTVPTWLGSLVFDHLVTADAENQKYLKHIRSSAGLAVFVAEREDHEHWVRVGRSCQSFALQATALGLRHAFINQPVEVPRLREELSRLVGTPGRRPDLVMRFGRGPTLPVSPRRPVEAVIDRGNDINAYQ